DTIILARGGGSIEDLWCFNDERVVKAVYDARIPIVSGIGHETDTTLTDYVADLRAPTPTAAAELAVPSLVQLKETMMHLQSRLTKLTQVQFMAKEELLQRLKNAHVRHHPQQRLHEREQ